MKVTVVLMFLVLFTVSCEKDSDLKGTGVLKNLTGLDGCGWVIQYDAGGTTKRVEPTNLRDFNVPLSQGLAVDFSYNKTGGASICMVGDVVKLTSLTKK